MAATSTKNIVLSNSRSFESTNNVKPALNYEAIPEDDLLTVKVEVPGVDPTEIEVHFDSTMLYVETERGVMSLCIDASLDTGKIKADVKWGLLTLHIPRRSSQSVKVNILDTASTTQNKKPSKVPAEI